LQPSRGGFSNILAATCLAKEQASPHFPLPLIASIAILDFFLQKYILANQFPNQYLLPTMETHH
jgi:hypothetical protein